MTTGPYAFARLFIYIVYSLIVQYSPVMIARMLVHVSEIFKDNSISDRALYTVICAI